MRTAIVAALVTLQAMGSLATIYMIGKPRQPISAGTGATTVVISALFIAGVLYLA
jgi:hypothetical protein